ncbi:MAG: hypothetical protein JWO77_1427 [Ilumatobacteraceae bacterium]|nr:hypothetical protein [Ilumatobacteraceae bacterium]
MATVAAAMVIGACPAGAAVTVTSSGTQITVSATGDEVVSFSCSGGGLRVSGVAPSPTVACSAFTGGSITGDGGNQTIRGDQITAATFPAFSGLTITTNGGNDAIYSSPASDNITAGAGSDAVVVDIRGKADAAIAMGGNTADGLYLEGTTADDAISVSSSGSGGQATAQVGSAAPKTWSFTAVTTYVLTGYEGDDVLSTKQALNANPVTLDGGPGDDTLETGSSTSDLFGGIGTNTYKGGQGIDSVHSVSDTDVINGGAGNNIFYDENSLRSGGRTITTGSGASDTYEVDLERGDTVWRARRGTTTGTTDLTASLNRPGQQRLPSTVDQVTATFSDLTEPADHTIADIEAPYAMAVTVKDGNRKTTAVDITVPTGSWTTSGTIGHGSGTVTPDAFATYPINLVNVGPVSVHGPWTNKNRAFVHRATRDLLFRFASTAALDFEQAGLTNGTLTRPQVTALLMDSDEYRGLDVDRTFVKYLRRTADPGGRSYWINSIDNGKALWRFRAQLFGSNEYFTKAGATNALYVAKAYEDVLGRKPDPSGQTYWTNKLNNGADRGSVALQFINSPEARRRLVDDQFLRFVGRKPTATEQTTWVDALPNATGEEDLIANLVNGAAYYDRT